MESLLAWLVHYGYAGLFALLLLGILGLPIPDETLLVFCGYLIYRGRLRFGPAFLCGFAGSVCGISLSYYLGRRFGSKVVHRYGKYVRLTSEHVHQVNSWFHRIGSWLLTIGYFIPGVRHFTALVAGMSGLDMGTFAAFAYPGAALWVALFLTLGYLFGERWEHTSELVHRYTLIASAVAAVVLALLWCRHKLRRRRAARLLRDQI
jgi:membrane protein DedA with SNARE-associated domain